MRTLKTLAASAAVAALMLAGTAAQAAPCDAPIAFGAAFAADYSCTTLGTPSGIPANLGGITFLDNNTLLIGGAANGGSGVIRSIDVLRDGNNHIIGFDGVSSDFASAPYIDGGLAYGPGGVLFATTYSNNTLLQFKPGSSSPDKIIDLTAEGIASSTGTLQFVPLGFNGAGGMKIASYNAGTWYDVTLTADGSGTYDIDTVTYINTPGRGPEGIVYVDGANDGFGVDSVLLSEFGTCSVGAYDIDANGNLVLASRRDFLTGLSGAEGAIIDPLTGDFLFSTFGGGNQVVVISGFERPVTPGIPEPSTWAMLIMASPASARPCAGSAAGAPSPDV